MMNRLHYRFSQAQLRREEELLPAIIDALRENSWLTSKTKMIYVSKWERFVS